MLVLATSAFAQHTEKVEELRQFLEEQGFKMWSYQKSYFYGNEILWNLSQDVRYPTPQANDNMSEAEAMRLQQQYDSIGRSYQSRMEIAVDSVRKVFLSLASESDDCDIFEYHKNGVDTVRLSLRFPPYRIERGTSLGYFQEWLRFIYTQNLNDKNPLYRVNAELSYHNNVPWSDHYEDSISNFDKQEYDSLISSVVQPMLRNNQVFKYPLFWKWDADYYTGEKDIEGSFSKKRRNRQITGSHWFFPKKYEKEAIATLLLLDSLTEDYVDKHPQQCLSYLKMIIGRPWSLDFYSHYDNHYDNINVGLGLLSGFVSTGVANVIIRKEEDGIHLLSLISSEGVVWYPHGWTKLERWENGAATPLPAPAITPSPTFLYSSNSSLTVEAVEQTADATELAMRVKGTPYGSFNIQSSMHLVDEQGRPVPIIGVKEFALDRTIVLPESGVMDFTLRFGPLPKGTRIFDLIEGQHSNAFRIYGITDGKQKVEIPVRTEGIDPKEVTEASMRPDSVCIRGHFANYSRKTMPRFVLSDYHSDDLDTSDGSIYPICCRIDSLGYFSLSFLADHAVWNFLELVEDNRLLPFLVYPGDTLQIDIANYGQWNEAVSYKSLQGRNTCSGLMHLGRDLMEQYYPGTAKYNNLDSFTKEESKFYSGKSRFYDYIVWKYRLTPWEAHLLESNLTMNKTINSLSFLNELQYLRSAAWLKLPEEQRPEYNSIQFLKPDQVAFLKEVNWNDPSLAFQFYWKVLMDVYYQYSPLHKFVYEANMNWSGDMKNWSTDEQKQFREKLLEDLPNLAPNLVKDFVRVKAPWAENIFKTRAKDTFLSAHPAVQSFIQSILQECTSEFLQLLFLDSKTALDQDKWYNKYRNIIDDFAESQQINFVLVIEGNGETAKMERNLRNRFPKTQIRFVPTETFLDLCEGLRIWNFPEDWTINNKGEFFKDHLHSYNERMFRDGLKRLSALVGKK